MHIDKTQESIRPCTVYANDKPHVFLFGFKKKKKKKEKK